jgi:hypothetical protein
VRVGLSDHCLRLVFGQQAARVHDDATGVIALDHPGVLGRIVGSDEVGQKELAQFVVQAHAGHVLVGEGVQQLRGLLAPRRGIGDLLRASRVSAQRLIDDRVVLCGPTTRHKKERDERQKVSRAGDGAPRE